MRQDLKGKFKSFLFKFMDRVSFVFETIHFTKNGDCRRFIFA